MREIREGDEYKMPSGRLAEVVNPCDDHGDVLLVYPFLTESVHVTEKFLRGYCDPLTPRGGISGIYGRALA